MGSLLSGTTNSCTPIRPLHASFHNFLTDKSSSRDFFIEVSNVQHDLALASLRVMEHGLRFNICDLKLSHLPNSQDAGLPQRVKTSIPPYYSMSSGLNLFNQVESIRDAALSARGRSALSIFSSPAHPVSVPRFFSLSSGTWVIVNILFFADHVLQLHHQAVENWCNWFGHLIKLEEDIATILRDREIILIKLSKSSKTTRDESTKFSSFPSAISTSHGSPDTEFLQAQEELCACEACLANKELESEALRIGITGLSTHCWALDGLLRGLQSLDVSSSDGQVPERITSIAFALASITLRIPMNAHYT
ncbi:uncharacterized protein HD556DRAFT_1450036 [Suillus plorans]|uniref:Uncharacterized protein n=1 Tax=Suillus plorans TaxID=116603 RepID=A0A9P7ABU3_9AGAM|nr:uncharacterized protein HD556DRAFT_1450036 [Suillus plorans]KAG1786056.1 hypothetical protein HD556DRAFT_1450036 [Suillus plorans]